MRYLFQHGNVKIARERQLGLCSDFFHGVLGCAVDVRRHGEKIVDLIAAGGDGVCAGRAGLGSDGLRVCGGAAAGRCDAGDLLAAVGKLTAEYGRIGNNLNQIAKVANESGSVYQKDIEDLQEEFKYFRTAMQSYLFPISPTYIS